MTTMLGRPAVRRVLPWMAGWLALQVVGALTGLLLARRKDKGDESSASIRRVRVMGGVQLRPHSAQLSRVRLDLVMAGAELDLTGLPHVPGGVDLTVHAVMAGAEVRVPEDWRVWLESSGPGGVNCDAGLRRAEDQRFADLRVHAHVTLAGVAMEKGAPSARRPG